MGHPFVNQLGFPPSKPTWTYTKTLIGAKGGGFYSVVQVEGQNLASQQGAESFWRIFVTPPNKLLARGCINVST